MIVLFFCCFLTIKFKFLKKKSHAFFSLPYLKAYEPFILTSWFSNNFNFTILFVWLISIRLGNMIVNLIFEFGFQKEEKYLHIYFSIIKKKQKKIIFWFVSFLLMLLLGIRYSCASVCSAKCWIFCFWKLHVT